MEIRRFFINPEDFDGKIATIRGDEFIHATKVLRQKKGYTIIFCICDGFDYYAEINNIEKDYLTAKLLKKEINNTATKHKITLYQGSLKGGKNDFIVQKAVELGVSRICFFKSKNTIENNIQLERLNRISFEASKQCGRSDIVKVNFLSFDEVINQAEKTKALMFYENEHSNSINTVSFNGIETVSIIIGSEGGFDASEAVQAKNAGIAILSLGARILRAETASIVATALTMNKLGEM